MWQWSCFKRKISLILLIIITPNVIGDNDNVSHDIETIRACGSSTDDLPSSRLVFISTLDGKLTALDILNNGEKKWALDFDDIPLISSSIHKRELNDDGHWVKLIPSLNGRLYKFDGDTVEQIPVTTDHLLQSSFRYSDNLVFSGGKEIQTYGVTSNNGKILYHCTINGCNNNTDGDRLYDDVLIVQRLQQTIRAVEPATGTEKWNYSVGTHELNLVATERPCFKNPNHHNNHYYDDNIDIKVIIPQGLIWAIDKNNPTEILWRYQFDTPIVTVWQQTHNYGANGHYYDAIKELNLFDNKQWSWGQDYPTDPSIYVGMHERQVYVQESKSRKFFEISDLTNSDNNKNTKIIDNHNNINNNIYPWKPYPAHESSILRIENSGNNNEISNTNNVEDSTAAGLSILYNSGYVDGNGYYLYTQNHQEQSANCNKTTDNSLLNGSENSEPVLKDAASGTTGTAAVDKDSLFERIIASLGWIEITALIFALIGIYLTKHITSNSDVGWSYSLPIIVEKYIDPVAPSKDLAPANNENNNVEFNSLYSAGFETINCLGKGGYGVVFEAKNKIDDCHYAIKRISLPDTQNSRDRVMREVKALAKLDHQNIVRYFHAWFECPPIGWQEKHDTVFINQQLSQSLFTTEDSCIDSRTVDTATRDSNSVCIDVAISGLDLIDRKITDDHNVSRGENDDSFIVFDTDKSISTEESDEVSDEIDDMENDCVSLKMEKSSSESVVFQLGSNSGDKNVDEEEEETDETEDENQKKMAVKNKTKKRDRHKKSSMFFYIQMQLCQRLSLQDWLKSPSNFSRNRNEIISIFQQIVDAVEYVHLQGMIHRDLKPSNILFSYDNKIKIGDFGLVTAMTEDDGISCKDILDNGDDDDDDSSRESNRKIKKHTANVGTHLYMSPEQINGVMYDYKVDIYSLGIILFELLVPFTTGMERMVTLGNLKKNIFPDDFADKHPKEYNLLTMMLDKDPRKRPTAIGIKARPPLSTDQSITDTKYHFTLPHISRNSSSVSSSNSAQSVDLNNST